MQVQIPMALIDIILKNMFMTCFDGRQLMAKKAASKRTCFDGRHSTDGTAIDGKKAAWGGIGHAGSNTNGFDKYHIREHVHDMLRWKAIDGKKSGIKSGHALMEGTRQTAWQLMAKKRH